MNESDVSIERTVDVGLSAEELWELVATADGWARWLVDRAEIVVSSGAGGVVIDGELTRVVRVDEVVAGRFVAFTWWDDDDAASASQVVLTVERTDQGTAQLRIDERHLGAPATSQTRGTQEPLSAWEVRIFALWACTVAAALV